MNGNQEDTSEMERRVLDAIETRGLKPRPYTYFLAKRGVFWTLAALSVLLGAIAVAVAIYGLVDLVETGGGNFDEMPLDDYFETIPFIWLATFGLLIASAFFGVRQTPRNYRHRLSTVLGVIVAVTVALGALLAVLEVGKLAHRYLLENVPAYDRLVFSREDIWREPDKGYLGGTVDAIDGTTLTLTDFFGKSWKVDFAGAEIDLEEPLEDEEELAIRGKRTGEASFQAGKIEEWD